MVFSEFSLGHDVVFSFLSFDKHPVLRWETCWNMLRLLSFPLFPSSAQIIGLAAASAAAPELPSVLRLSLSFELSEIAPAKDTSKLGPQTPGNFSDYYWYLGATSSPYLHLLLSLLAHLLQLLQLFEYLQQGFGEFSTYSHSSCGLNLLYPM